MEEEESEEKGEMKGKERGEEEVERENVTGSTEEAVLPDDSRDHGQGEPWGSLFATTQMRPPTHSPTSPSIPLLNKYLMSLTYVSSLPEAPGTQQ